jgi:DNA polymerase-3 subunit epsilon
MAKIFYYDTETTGVKHWKNGIHQISGAIEIDGEIKEYFDFKIQPYKDAVIEDEALAISGITREDIAGYMTFADGYRAMLKLILKYVDRFNKKDKFFLCGYNNASFDNSFFRAFFVQNLDNYFGSYFWSSTLDAMILAGQKLMNERHLMIDFKQSTVAKYLGIEVDETKLHDAEYDVNLLIQIYKIVA